MGEYYTNSTYKQYRKLADTVEWIDVNVNDLFKNQVANDGTELGDAYFAALVCRFFGYSGRIFTQCNYHVTFEDCVDCIVDALRYVLKKRVWENPESTLYNDKNGPDKAIHIAMKRQKGIMLSRMSAQRRMSNFNTMSIDEAHENFNDSADGMLFGDNSEDDSKIRNLVSSYFIEEDNYLNGIILDCICFSSTDNEIQNIIKELKKLNKVNEDYLVNSYSANRKFVRDTIIEIKKSSTQYLEMKIKSLLYTLKREIRNND